MTTLTFEEFVNFKTEYRFSKPDKELTDLAAIFAVHKESLRTLLDEYLNFGGYPRVVLADTSEKKRIEIDDIYQSYLQRDIEQLLNIKKTDRFGNLVRMIAAQAGNLVNITELSRSLGVAQETINNYLWYLEQTFIVKKVTPYFRNVRSEITNSPIYYFVDLGLKNYSINQFGIATQLIPPPGMLFENFVFNDLHERLRLKLSAATIHFWRTQEKAEVDFVINTGLNVIPVEVKYTIITAQQITRSFRSFLDRYKPKEAYIVHLGEYFQTTYEGTTIHFLPFYNLQAIIEHI
jgi:predicted AAA+ superfamily ATPase